MRPFTVEFGIVAPLLHDDIDTDVIIPARFMRSSHGDPGAGLFAGWRFRADGSEEPGFILNRAPYREARFLLAGDNFGCGSSRENAVWAMAAFGLRCVIARGFSDAFYANALKNGLLAIALPEADHRRVVAEVAVDGPACRIEVSLPAQHLRLPSGASVPFAIDGRRRALLLDGQDEISATLRLSDRIDAFRNARRRRAPWLDPQPLTSSADGSRGDAS